MRYLPLQLIVFFSAVYMPVLAIAAPTGLGGVATNLLDPVNMFANFIGSGSIVVGIAFLLASFVKYNQHKRNEMAAPMSTVVFLLIMGLVLLAIPFAYKLTKSGVPVHF
jgi:intracellular multiplication protein IcmD